MISSLQFGQTTQTTETPYYIDLSISGAKDALKVWQKASGGNITSEPAKHKGTDVVQLSGPGLNHCSKGLGPNKLDQFKVDFASQRRGWVA